MKQVLTLICALLMAGVLKAQETIVTDRPDQTEASSVIPAGSFQLESGFLVQDFRSEVVDNRTIAIPNMLLRIGLNEWFELRVVNQFEFNYALTENIGVRTSGFADLQMGAKVQIFKKEESNTEVAFLAHGIIPSGFLDSDIETQFGVISRFLISHQINDKIGIGYNLGYDNYGEGDGNLTYTAVLGLGLNDKIGCFFEGYGEYLEFDELTYNVDAGVTYLVKPNIQLDYSYGIGLSENMSFMSCGLSWNFQ